MALRVFWIIVIFTGSIPINFAQSNRLTNENGQLIWQYNLVAVEDQENQNTLKVTFVFINGANQTAISLRQELFYSQIEWVETTNIQVEKEEYVDFLTANVAPNQSVVWKYVIFRKPSDNALILEKSALLIMDEDFTIRKEILPEQRILKP